MISISLSITISISIEKNKFTCNSNNIGFIQIISPFHICTLDNEKPSSHILKTFTYFKHPLSTTHFSSSPPLFCLEALFSRLGLQQSCQAILPHGCPLHAAEFWHLYLSVDMPLPFFYGFDSLHQATHPIWTPSSAHSASNPPCQSTLPCRSLSFCSQVLTLWADTFFSLRDTFSPLQTPLHPAWALTTCTESLELHPTPSTYIF